MKMTAPLVNALNVQPSTVQSLLLVSMALNGMRMGVTLVNVVGKVGIKYHAQ